jgi:hypothetical protein
MARPRKNRDRLVHEQLHVGLRFPEPMSDVLPKLVVAANAKLRAQGLPPRVSLSNMVAHWISERAAVEEARAFGTSRVHEWLGGPKPDPSREKDVYEHQREIVQQTGGSTTGTILDPNRHDPEPTPRAGSAKRRHA